MEHANHRAACRAIRREAQWLLKQQPPQHLGLELWRMLKLLKSHPGSASLHAIYSRTAALKPLRFSEELKEGMLRIMVAARYQVDFRSKQPEGDRS